MQQTFYELLKEEKEKGTTIFYSTHILSEISKICDRVAIIKDGSLLNIETMKEMHEKNLTFVTVESNEIEEIVKNLDLEIILHDKKLAKFKNTLPADTLLKELTKYKIDKVLIEEASLEDIFLHYYK